ncbi:response regulator [Enterococcus casseliflavus]|uniref:response regulator transcription factor n=1 Tax=Enterococcus casseliflavus TaxID=37734 RepID=UPI002FBE8709
MYQVFLVDDEPWNLVALEKMIDWQSLGFSIVGEADDGEIAWERICKNHLDVIITDIRMPNLGGLELIHRIRKQNYDVEVIFISGFEEFSYVKESLRLEAVDYLLKPVQQTELVEVLQRIKGKLDQDQKKNDFIEEIGYHSQNTILIKTMDYLEKHYQEKLKLADLANLFGLSENYFAAQIKRTTGRNFTDLLLELRIKKAKELLAGTNLSVAEIADTVGYTDYFYFTKVYKKATGLTPAQFRRKL